MPNLTVTYQDNHMTKGFTLIKSLIIIGVVSTLAILAIAGTKDINDANYKVEFDGSTYYVEAYTKENQGQCVYLAEFELRFCGDWSVEKLHVEEEY